MDIRISQLAQNTSLSGSDQVLTNVSGPFGYVTKRASLDDVTDYVASSINISNISTNVIKVSTDSTVDSNATIILASGSAVDLNLSLPQISTLTAGKQYTIKKIDSNTTSVNVAGYVDPTTFSQKQVLSGSLATGSNDQFGISVALNAAGNIALVGALLDETGSNGQPEAMGVAYIFRSSSTGWYQEKYLTGSLATGAQEQFGISVALNSLGNVALIGAWQDETGSGIAPSVQEMGIAYIFRSSSTGWYEEKYLTGSLAIENTDLFGSSVALNDNGDLAVVGATGDETGSNGQPAGMGIAYIFRSGTNGWYEEKFLTGSFATSSGDTFGHAVALNAAGNIVIVGAPYDESVSNDSLNAGVSYIFRSASTGWIEEKWLTGSFATGSDDNFGYSVALNAAGNVAVVGAPYDETGSNGQPNAMGVAYIFRSGTNGWFEERALTGSLATGSNDRFGISVALNAAGNIAMIGAPADETGSNGQPASMGITYIFYSGSNGWNQTAVLSGSLATGSGDFFGYSVALNAAGNVTIVGATQDETGSNGQPNAMGLAYIFEPTSETIDGEKSVTIAAQYDAVTLVSDATGSWYLV